MTFDEIRGNSPTIHHIVNTVYDTGSDDFDRTAAGFVIWSVVVTYNGVYIYSGGADYTRTIRFDRVKRK